MSAAAQRKAWNDAMRSAAGTAALPLALQPPNTTKRRSDRRKKQDRRDKARKASSNDTNSVEGRAFLAAAWMDALEDVAATAGGIEDHDEDDDYDELEELGDEDDDDDDDEGGGGRSKKSRKRARKSGGGGGNSKGGGGSRRKSGGGAAAAAGTMPKYLKPRTLASILLEEVNRDDGVAFAWLASESRIATAATPSQVEGGSGSATKSSSEQPPARKFCPVTGMEGVYREPKTGIPYANLKALEQIRERPPPWLNLSGNVAYHEAVKSIRDE